MKAARARRLARTAHWVLSLVFLLGAAAPLRARVFAEYGAGGAYLPHTDSLGRLTFDARLDRTGDRRHPFLTSNGHSCDR